MKRILQLLILIITTGLVGCSSMQYHPEHYAGRFSKYGYGYSPKDSIPAPQSQKNNVVPSVIKKYTDRIAFELSKQIKVSELTGVAVASYVDLDDNLTSSNALGNKLAEALIMSLHEFGFNLIELNLSEGIESNQQGTFVFDREQHNDTQPSFVIAGIISYQKNSVTLNTRLMNTSDSTILATNALSMPNFIMAGAYPTVEGANLLIKTN
ncbi:MAG: FlgO family outer membrane protein [Colwellia sp.]|nr:FlgO family outer membrane protein [Colwellia sp.]